MRCKSNAKGTQDERNRNEIGTQKELKKSLKGCKRTLKEHDKSVKGMQLDIFRWKRKLNYAFLNVLLNNLVINCVPKYQIAE